MLKIVGMKLKSQSGMVLPLAIILLAVASLIVVPGLWSTGTMLKVNQELEGSTMGYYAAKAGIADAYYQIKPAGVAPTFPYTMNSTVNGMTVVISLAKAPVVQGATTTYYLRSTAKLNNVEKANIHASINVNTTTGYPFEYAIASTDGNVDLRSTAKIISIPVDGEADIFANGNILNSTTSGYVHGQAGASGTINSCNNIQGGCLAGQPPVEFQNLDMTWYWAEACKGLAYSRSGWPAPSPWPNATIPPPYTGTRTYEISGSNNILGTTGRITYIDGNLRIKSSQTQVTIKGVVWVNGWIHAEGNCSLTTAPDSPGAQCYLIARAPKTSEGDGTYAIIINSNTHINSTGNLSLIAENGGVWLKGNMKADNGANAKMGIVYSPDSKVFVEANTYSEFGSIIGKSVELRSNIWINYNSALRTNPPEGFEINVVAVEMAGYGAQ
jgi:hypothetical protein